MSVVLNTASAAFTTKTAAKTASGAGGAALA